MLAAVLLLSAPGLAFAQLSGGNNSGTSGGNNPGLSGGNTLFTLQNPLNFETFCGLLKGLFNALLIVGVPVAMFFIAYAGFLFVTARGNPDKLRIAKLNALYVTIGIGVFLGAWFLAQIIAATIRALPGGPTILSC